MKQVTVITNVELGWDCVVAVVEGDELEAVTYLNCESCGDLGVDEYVDMGYMFHSTQLVNKQ